jgi:hypothetical protein
MMTTLDRRGFLSTISCSLATFAAGSLAPIQRLFAGPDTQAQNYSAPRADNRACWLDVCAPFIVEDAARGIHTEIILTSDTFASARGHEDGAQATDYEIYLYDRAGQAVGADGVARRMTVPAMQTTVIAVRDLIGDARSFWGGATIRLRPRGLTHASDLFSSAFVRWQTAGSFDNIHANPDPRQWQNTQRYYYSMPFPALADYDCTFCLFNPYGQRSTGELSLHDSSGRRVAAARYELKPHASLLYHLNAGGLVGDPSLALSGAGEEKAHRIASSNSTRAVSSLPRSPATAAQAAAPTPAQGSGLLAVTNDEGAAKSFGYLLIRQHARARFSVEHPIHQGIFQPRPVAIPFDTGGQFKAKNELYSPLLFRAKRLGGLTLESRCYFGTGLPLEEALWLYPFVTDGEGKIAWSVMEEEKLAAQVPAAQTERRVIRLGAGQSCALDFSRLTLPSDFSGGIGVAVSPDTSHTLLKMEVRVPEWGAHAFTHFRPGIRSARAYQQPPERGGLATDYIASGARLWRDRSGLLIDELIGVMNIDDRQVEARPVLELFGPRGLLTRIPLGAVPTYACRHYLLSELLTGTAHHAALSLRLVDEKATLLMSTLHLDHARRDIALDHGSDRFSTFLDYRCQ